MADTVLWTILMLLTASGLFFNRKAGEFRRICTRRRRAYLLPKIKRLEMLCGAAMYSFLALSLWSFFNGKSAGNIVVLALFAGLALFETIVAFRHRRLFFMCLWGVSFLAVWVCHLYQNIWLKTIATVLIVICCWMEIRKFYKH